MTDYNQNQPMADSSDDSPARLDQFITARLGGQVLHPETPEETIALGIIDQARSIRPDSTFAARLEALFTQHADLADREVPAIVPSLTTDHPNGHTKKGDFDMGLATNRLTRNSIPPRSDWRSSVAPRANRHSVAAYAAAIAVLMLTAVLFAAGQASNGGNDGSSPFAGAQQATETATETLSLATATLTRHATPLVTEVTEWFPIIQPIDAFLDTVELWYLRRLVEPGSIIYIPSYIPEGLIVYPLSVRLPNPEWDGYQFEYRSTGDDTLILTMHPAGELLENVSPEAEGQTVETITFGPERQPAELVSRENWPHFTLRWEVGARVYSLRAHGQMISREEILRIAETLATADSAAVNTPESPENMVVTATPFLPPVQDAPGEPTPGAGTMFPPMTATPVR